MATPVKLSAIVSRVIKHNDQVVSFRFQPCGRVPKFHPGQFLHLTLEAHTFGRSWPESRVFSIASATAERSREIGITVSVKGEYTKRIYDTLNEGRECWLKLPYGEFLFPADRPLILVAGGVGITPYIALFHKLLAEKSNQAIHLFYGVRSAPYYLFDELLARCSQVLPNFCKTIYCEDGTLPSAQHGMLDIKSIYSTVSNSALYFLSGPPLMVHSFQLALGVLGVQSDAIRVDAWE